MTETIRSVDTPEVPLNQEPKKTKNHAAKLALHDKVYKAAEAHKRKKEEADILAIKAKLGLVDAKAIKQKFLEPFTDEDKREFTHTFKEAAANPEATKLFEKNVSGNVTFIAYKTEKRFGGSIMFRIMEGEDIKAQITFNPEDGNVLNMVHREAQSQALGISGSSLLQKIDEYFRILQESNALSPATALSIDAGQVSVAEWARKNAYGFEDVAQEELFQAIASGQKEDEYIVTNIGDGKLFDSYIFKRDVYYRYKSDIEKNPTTLAKKYSVRFKLLKKLRANE